jgi:uncharacterized protein YciI
MAKESFVYLARPTKANFIETVSDKDQIILGQHFDYLKRALESKQLVLAGPCTDAAFGVVIFEADSLDAANVFMNNDPAIKAGIFSGELHPYRISLMRE